jgi:hypothetical protein
MDATEKVSPSPHLKTKQIRFPKRCVFLLFRIPNDEQFLNSVILNPIISLCSTGLSSLDIKPHASRLKLWIPIAIKKKHAEAGAILIPQ